MNIFRKYLILGIIFLFVGAGVLPSINGNSMTDFKPINLGNWLYVGGNGTGNYTTIQSAIDDANDGDIIYVYNGIYHEHFINISKGVTIFGENRYKTIVDGDNAYYPIFLIKTNSNVTIFNLTIMNSSSEGIFSGGEYNPPYIDISGNIIAETQTGVFLNGMGIIMREIYIGGNKIKDNEIGINIIQLLCSASVDYNCIYNNNVGIQIEISVGPILQNNKITYNQMGIYCNEVKSSLITRNSLINNTKGVYLEDKSTNNIIEHNNFINNSEYHAFFLKCFRNKWTENYWDNWIGLKYAWAKWLPKLIIGRYGPFPWPNFDWYPASEPYPIAPEEC